LLAPITVVMAGVVIGLDTPVGHEGHADYGSTTGEFPELSVGAVVVSMLVSVSLLLVFLAVIALQVERETGFDFSQPRPPPAKPGSLKGDACLRTCFLSALGG
jgi:hypothetical protein